MQLATTIDKPVKLNAVYGSERETPRLASSISSGRVRRSPSRCRCAVANELILIVEDNDKNRKLMRDVLAFKGYRSPRRKRAKYLTRYYPELSCACGTPDISKIARLQGDFLSNPAPISVRRIANAPIWAGAHDKFRR